MTHPTVHCTTPDSVMSLFRHLVTSKFIKKKQIEKEIGEKNKMMAIGGDIQW